MSIHIHHKNNTTQSLFTITDELYEALTQAFDIFQEKTGLFIDPYGDARLTHQHAALLLQLVKEKVATKSIIANKQVNDFTLFLQKLINEQTDVELIGD